MRRWWMWWAVLSVAGLAIIAIPDAGPRLVSLSEGHGPSLTDAIGVLLPVAGWVALDFATWRRRRALVLPREVLILTVIAGAGAAGLVVWSVLGDHGAWWIASASVLAAIQVIGAVRMTWVDQGRDRP